MISVSRSLLRRSRWYTGLSLASLLLLLPPAPGASPLPEDDSPPIVTYTIDGIAGAHGWYRGSAGGNYIVVRWSVSDPESPIISTSGCEPAIRIDGPNTGTTRSCSATSDGGTTTVTTKLLKIDATPPTTVAAPSRSPNGAGWFNAPFTLGWNGTDATSGIDFCSASLAYSGPETRGTSKAGSCTDNAGNSSSASFLVKYDTVPPSSAVAASRPPNSAGWYRALVTLSWSGSDATSGVASCRSPLGYGGPDTSGTSVSGSCTDNAGNSSSAALLMKYDATAPATSASSNPAPNGNGWLRSPASISWHGTDATSGIASCSQPVGYSGPDTGGTSRIGSCIDNAGNTSSATFVVRYDTVAPLTSAAPARPPNGAGWYRAAVTIGWSGSDATSGIDFCSGSVGYSGPDTTGTTRTGSCTDRAGNSSSASFLIRYDATAPSLIGPTAARGPDHNGWYNQPVRIDWGGSDSTSGIASCASATYSGPDAAHASLSGGCTDVAGNAAGSAFALAYDATGPTVTVTAGRSPDHDGWYVHPVAISWSGTDATSGVDSCSSPVTYNGPDSSNASSAGGCTDRAGNSATPPALAFRYDATAPVVAALPSRPPDANGWYNHPLTIAWKGSDPVSGVASCSSLAYGGPDAGSASRNGICSDGAGNTSAPVSFGFRYDSTAPRGTAVSAARPPDHAGWYNHAVAIRWSAADALAGIWSCTSLAYHGPDTAGADLLGSCTDRAGNTSNPARFALRYDGTPPAFAALAVKALNGLVRLRWRVAGAESLRISRSPGMSKAAASALYEGRGSAFVDRRVENYVRYRYTLAAEDAAGNTARRSAFAIPRPALYAPRPGARLGPRASVLFAWRPVQAARYYNLQLWHDRRAAGSWWPPLARLRLPSRWRFRGRAHRLEPGVYTWYVWPGRGPRRRGRYGPLLGKSTFVVR